jgi:hypothetical protein
MPKLTQQEADLALHAYGQRMRTAWTQRHADMEKHLAAFKETVRDEWGRERVKAAEPKIEAPKIEEPKIGPAKDKSDGPEPGV